MTTKRSVLRHEGNTVPTILAIDDDQIFQLLVKRIFEPMGVQVMSAYTSDEGLELAHRIHPDVILVDIRLPGKIGDGWALAKTFRQTDDLQNSAIIMVSASNFSMGEMQTQEGEFQGYFAKPFKVDAFRDAIMRFLS
jgi:CheY-like chemotaxis protein